MKYIHVYALFLMSVFHTSCGQNQTNYQKKISSPKPKTQSLLMFGISSKIEMGTFGLQQVMVFFDTMENRLPISQVN